MNNSFKKSKSSAKLNYLLVFLVIAFSGIPFFSGNIYLLVVAFLFASILYFMKFKKIEPFFLLYNYLLIMLILIQAAVFSHISVITSLSLIIRFAFPFFVIFLLRERFLDYYIKIIYIFSIISFLFYVPSIFIPGFKEFLINNIAPLFDMSILGNIYRAAPNLIIYTMNHGPLDLFLRNSGPFWEPGGFTCFLITALLFNILKTGKLDNIENRVFVIAILTTFSTAGYIALMFILLFYYRYISKRLLLTPFSILFILALSVFGLIKIPFLFEKIHNQISVVQYGDLDGTSRSRFVSAAVDFQDIKDYPLTGVGRNVETRFRRDIDAKFRHRNNGITDFAVKFGLIGFFLYFLSMFKSFKILCIYYKRNEKFALAALFIIFIIGMAQVLFIKSFFISLIFLHLTYGRLNKANLPKLNKHAHSYHNTNFLQ